MTDLTKFRKLLTTALESAQSVMSKTSPRPRSHMHIHQSGRANGLKEAIMMLDGYRKLKKTK